MDQTSEAWEQICFHYMPLDHVCTVCAQKAAMLAWAKGEHDVRPPDQALKEVILGLDRKLRQ